MDRGGPVVVGVDGSDAAINAALWAIDEALARDVALRLIHAIPAAGAELSGLDIEYAETALRSADAAIIADGRPVKVDTTIVNGESDAALVAESGSAAMICIGSVGIGRVGAMVLGSTAAVVAKTAACPVAIVRSRRGGTAVRTGWIVVAVSDAPGGDAVVAHGFAEAALRGAGLVAVAVRSWGNEAELDALLDRTLDRWSPRYPDVTVSAEISPVSITEYIAGSEDDVQLAVVGAAEARHICRFVGPVGGVSLLDHAECSVLVVR